MLYDAYQLNVDSMLPMRALAGFTARAMHECFGDEPENPAIRGLLAVSELVAQIGLKHERPPFEIDRVKVDGRSTTVREEVIDATPFGSLLHFAKDSRSPQPRVLVVAPLSGHFATLLRETVRTLLREHDVYLTDWHNARDIGRDHGPFGLDEYIDHVIRFLDVMGPGGHVMAICQPCVPVLAAVSVMAADRHRAQPRSMTLMAGPVDARINPSKVNELATNHPIGWFERNSITTVPIRYPGAFRRVYPGFLQLASFLGMNPRRHLQSHYDLIASEVGGRYEHAHRIREFYDEYFAVLDLPAEFYLETVQRVFQQHLLAQGRFEYRGRVVEPQAIRRTALLTIEGERDDICSPGQTLAAHELCRGIRPARKRHHLQAGVGHYGTFSGRRWENEIYPIVRTVVQSSD